MTMSPAQAKMAARAEALAAEQALRRAQPVVDNRQLGGTALTTPQVQPVQDTRQLGGSSLFQIPLEQRQALINQAQGGPASYYGQSLTTPQITRPQGPVRPQVMPQRAPQPRTGGPGPMPQPRGPVAAPQPQARPEPNMFQQAMSYVAPVSQGINAFRSLFSLF